MKGKEKEKEGEEEKEGIRKYKNKAYSSELWSAGCQNWFVYCCCCTAPAPPDELPNTKGVINIQRVPGGGGAHLPRVAPKMTEKILSPESKIGSRHAILWSIKGFFAS